MIKHFKLSTLYINTGWMLQQTARETHRRKLKTTGILKISDRFSFYSSVPFRRGVCDFEAQVRPGRFME